MFIHRLALDQCRKDLGIAQSKINNYKHEYGCVVPQADYDLLEAKFKKVQ